MHIQDTTLDWLYPDWPAPASVRAIVTTRCGGASLPPFDKFNLAAHVGDDLVAVTANRRRLVEVLALPREPGWLRQVHGISVAMLDGEVSDGPEADASFSATSGRVCAVLTADCLPVLFCDRAGTRVAAAHAGWRGLAGGVLEATVTTLAVPADGLLAWLGPAIGPRAFEVSGEVRDSFLRIDPGDAVAFDATRSGHWHADLYRLARRRLARVGVEAVYGGGYCTFNEAGRFYSFRRDGTTGRMASLVWLAS
jgi:YfiH family protein